MSNAHQTLKQSLTTTIFLWGIGFLVALLTLFFIFSQAVEAYIIALVQSDNFIQTTLSTTVGWLAVFILIILLVAVKALHYSLNRQLVEPVEHLQLALEQQGSEADLHRLVAGLPYETSRILEVYDQLKSSHDVLKNRIIDMMEALPACFWWSHDGKTYHSASSKSASILNIPAAAFQDQPLWDWTSTTSQASSNMRRLQQAIKNRDERLDFAFQVQSKDEPSWFGESITICYDHKGDLDVIYGIITDISSRKNRQRDQAEQLEVSNRLETTATLAGGIAHEFNNALAGMNGNVFLIKQSTDDQPTLNRIKRIEQLIDHSAAMIDNMLAFARKSTLNPNPIALVTFLKSFQTAVLPTLPDRAQFNLQLDSTAQTTEQATIRADQKKLQEVLMQLIQNATQATEHVGTPCISIGLENLDADETLLRKYPNVSSTHLVHIQVQDNGCGIAENIRGRVFEPFFTTRDIGTGTGLGLSMVHGYINQIGGAIDVESSEGNGSIFHIYLPRITLAQPAKHKGLLHGQGEKILVVDDDQIFRESTCEILNRMGYTTISAWDGEEAIRQFNQHKDDLQLIFMDILMPGLTGIQASRRIRKIDADIPIIFLTAYDRTQPLECEVYEKNAELITKPFRISVLSQAIQKALQQTRTTSNS